MSANDPLQQAYQLIRAGNRQDAVQILMPVLRANPANADAWWLLANAVTDPSQKQRALEEVLKLLPNDDRAQRMLNDMAAGYAPPPAAPPSPISEPFPGSPDPFARTSDPFTSTPTAPPPSYAPPLSTSQQPNYGTPAPNWSSAPGNVPPAPIYNAQPKGGPSCCLIFAIVAALVFCIAPLLCVGAGLAGLSPAFNDLAQAMGAADFRALGDVFSGRATPLPNSALDNMFTSMGVSNVNDMQGTLEDAFSQFATVGGTPGIFGTVAASINTMAVGQLLEGTPPRNRGSIEPGQTLNGETQSGSIGDAYLFQANAGTTYTIDAAGGAGVDTVLAVVDSSNVVVAFNDDGGEDSNARLEFEAPAAGKYTIIVGTYTRTGGSYRLTLAQ